MPSYKLTYFPVTGLAEPIRFLLSYAGIEFVDERLNRDDWTKLKPNMPHGKVPVLEIDGKKMHQSVAICRFLAKQCGLAGKDEWESQEIDATVDAIHDLRIYIVMYGYEKNEQAKEMKKQFVKEAVPQQLKHLDTQVKNNGGYLVGGALTWADLTFVGLLDYLEFVMKEDIIKNYENLKQLKKKVEAIPEIKSWIEKRPPSVYPTF